jgi:hypothetical protein
VELSDGTFLNLFGVHKWGGSSDFLVLHYPEKGQVILKDEDARRVYKCLVGFSVPFPETGHLSHE